MLAFGNYLITPLIIKKVVLLHHPYLVDNKLLSHLSLANKLIEELRRFVFWITLKYVSGIVVQSEYMKTEFNKVWRGFEGSLEIIANPISNNFKRNITDEELKQLMMSRLEKMLQKVRILYVSRYYPHKNHSFLIKLSKHLNDLKLNHEIMVTINSSTREADDFLNEIRNNIINIINIGEQSQSNLENVYLNSHIFIFPSKSETFGNPLIEAIKFGLPVIVPSLSYSKAIVGDAGIYYNENDVTDCANKILELCQSKVRYFEKSSASVKQFALYPDAKSWFDKYRGFLLKN